MRYSVTRMRACVRVLPCGLQRPSLATRVAAGAINLASLLTKSQLQHSALDIPCKRFSPTIRFHVRQSVSTDTVIIPRLHAPRSNLEIAQAVR